MNLHATIYHEHESDSEVLLTKATLVNKEGFHTPPKNPLCTVDNLRALQQEHQDKDPRAQPNVEQAAPNDGFIKVSTKKLKKKKNSE